MIQEKAQGATHRRVDDFLTRLSTCGLIAILRGIRPDEVLAIAEALYVAGFRLIEVPLNSPQPLQSIQLLAERLPGDAMVGAGTVLSPRQVTEVQSAGGQLIVMPHSDGTVIRTAAAAGLVVLPGVATPTEAFAALAAGATGLKAFPAELLSPVVLKAWRAVLPPTVPLLPVGGITPEHLEPYLAVGVTGFGLGGALYRQGDSAATVGARAQAFVARWCELRT